MSIPANIIDSIRRGAKEAWPDDKDMQQYMIKTETDAYKEFTEIDFSNVPETIKSLLIGEAEMYYSSWEEITSSVLDELEAYVALNNYSFALGGNELLQEWKKEAEKENENNFRGQLDFIDTKAQKFKNILDTKKKIDPIKVLLIELENIVGNEFYNKNIQNYSRWGELESEGRSYRYPVTFNNGVSNYKTRNVFKDIPSEDLITGYYACGANDISIYRALNKVLRHLVENYGLKLPETSRSDQ